MHRTDLGPGRGRRGVLRNTCKHHFRLRGPYARRFRNNFIRRHLNAFGQGTVGALGVPGREVLIVTNQFWSEPPLEGAESIGTDSGESSISYPARRSTRREGVGFTSLVMGDGWGDQRGIGVDWMGRLMGAATGVDGNWREGLMGVRTED